MIARSSPSRSRELRSFPHPPDSVAIHIKLAGGESTGFPMGVTYAEESPPSTAKSVPFKAQHEIREGSKVLTINVYRYVTTVVAGHCKIISNL